MTAVGGVALLLAVAGLVLRRPALCASALGFGAGVPATAGVSIGPVALSAFVVVALLLAVAPAPRSGAPVQDVGVSLLIAFSCWALLVTAIGPWAFAGVPVLTPGKGVDDQVHAPSSLAYAIGNAAQVTYLLAGLAAARHLWRTGTAPLALSVAAWTGSALSAARGLLKAAGADVTAPFFDTLDISYSAPGDDRLRGIFSEPSELAAFSLAVVAYAAVRTARAEDARVRRWSFALFLLAATNLFASASGTAVVAGCVVAAILASSFAVRFFASGGRHAGPISVALLALVFIGTTSGPQLLEPLMRIVDDKIGSQSLDARSAADAIGLQVVRETSGIGAGLGSNRSSSFLVTLASSTGIVGLALFGGAVLSLLCRSSRLAAATPAAAGLLGLLVAKSVSAPDLATPLLWVLLATCVHHAAAREPEPPQLRSLHPQKYGILHVDH